MTELLDEQIAADLDGHGIADEAVRNKLIPVLKPMKNRAERVDFLALMAKPEAAKPEPQNPLTNCDTAKTPGNKPGAATDAAAEAKKTALITNPRRKAGRGRQRRPGHSSRRRDAPSSSAW